MNRTFPSELIRLTREQPEQPSIYFLEAGLEDRVVTYQELFQKSTSVAAHLRKAGINSGDVVVLLIDYRFDLLTSFWGCVLQGAIPSILPFLTEKLNPDRYQADLRSLISVTRPAAIITFRDFEDIVEDAVQPDSSVQAILYLEDFGLDSDEDALPDFSLVSEHIQDPERIVLLQHSSGTTGLQKGVALSHGAVFNQLDALSSVLNLDPALDVVVSWLPLYHDMGLIAGFIMPILSGIPLVLMSPFDWVRAPYRLFEAVSKYKGTLTWLPNFAYNFCARKVRNRQLEGIDLSSWRAVINCSEPVRWESHQAFYERYNEFGLAQEALQTSYAMAENTFGVTQSKLGSQPRLQHIDPESYQHHNQIQLASEGKPFLTMMSSGVPLPNTRIRIQDQAGITLPENKIGEIALQSKSMLSEYYRRPEVTEKSFQDGWFMTGDYGYISDGELFVTGRKKDLIIVGGKNIYPGDLEELVYEVPGVHPGRAVVEEGNRQQLADRIRRYVTQNSPVSLRFVQIVDPKGILKTSSGKISRSANKEKYLSQVKLN
ncbi:MAG: AMP-binding protein [Anaerolineales bacterium]